MLDRERSQRAGRRRSDSNNCSIHPGEKVRLRWIARAALETLEPRRMLSTTNTAAPTANLRDLTNGPMAKAGGDLVDLYLDYRSAQAAKTLSTFNSKIAKTSVGKLLDINEGNVGVQVRTTGNLTTFEKQLKADGMDIRSVDAAGGVVAGYLPITLLHQLAIQGNVANINPLFHPYVYQEGISPNQADTALSAALARATYNLTGAGIKVGVISNSVSQVNGGLSDSVNSGDLPANVDVLSDGSDPGFDDDEGRAILEEIYDIAPGASLYFASGDGGQQAFANSITALQNAGCKVIIDDLAYEDEPFFQPGVIDDAITAAVNAGVSYFSAAGNEADDGFLQAANFVPGTLPALSGGGSGYLINFDPSSSTPETKMRVTYTGEGPLTLEWDDAYNGVTGTVNADLDFYLFNSAGTVVDFSSTDNNFQTGTPTEDLEVSAGTYDVEIVAKNTPTADLPRYYEFASIDSGLTLTSLQYGTSGTLTSILGHEGGADTISVGAVDYTSVPVVENSGANIPTEYFTSLGPVLHDRDASGNLITAVTLQKPDVSATDGNNTSFFGQDTPMTGAPDGLPYFYGTSSASGNAAAVAALLLQINPGLTEAELLSVLKTTAVPVNGQTAGSYNTAGGFGLIDADLAAAALESNNSGGGTPAPIAVPPTASIVAVTPDPTSQAVNTIEIDFDEPVTGFTLADLKFSFNGGVNLLTGAQSLTTTDNEHFFLTNLAPLDQAVGTYTLLLTASGSGIINAQGTALAFDASTTFNKVALIKLPAAPTNLTAEGISVGSIRLSWRDNSNNETEFIVQRATNPQFDSHLKTFTFPANTTSFTNGNLTAATQYYYRVYAISADGSSDFSNTANDFTYSRGESILDDDSPQVTVVGDWTSSTNVAGYYGDDYLDDGDAGKGTKSVTYTPTLPTFGEYYVYATWTRSPARATKVPFSVYAAPGQLLSTVYENERSSGGAGFVLLGEFQLHSGTLSSVVISNNTPGDVVADAIEFLPAAVVPQSSSSNTASASMVHAVSAADKKASTKDVLDDLVG